MEIELPVGTFTYRTAGEGDPMVLLHAMGRSGADWDDIVDRLAPHHRVFALDARGHGGSCRPGRYSFELMRDDLRDFADALDLERFHLIGHSMGASVSILFAERWPDRVARLVLEDTPPPSGNPRATPPPDEPPEPVDFDWPVIAALVTQLNDPDPRWWAELEKVTAPTLVIGGGPDSFIIQGELEEVARRIPSARMITIPAGHHVHSNRPEDFTREVLAFLAE